MTGVVCFDTWVNFSMTFWHQQACGPQQQGNIVDGLSKGAREGGSQSIVIHLMVYKCIHLFNQCFIQYLIHSSSFIHSFNQWLIHVYIHLYKHSVEVSQNKA